MSWNIVLLYQLNIASSNDDRQCHVYNKNNVLSNLLCSVFARCGDVDEPRAVFKARSGANIRRDCCSSKRRTDHQERHARSSPVTFKQSTYHWVRLTCAVSNCAFCLLECIFTQTHAHTRRCHVWQLITADNYLRLSLVINTVTNKGYVYI